MTPSAPGGDDARSGSNADTVQIDGAGALVWGEGDYGVVLAHGAAFDAASEPATKAILERLERFSGK